jgi:hypothetical protein
MRTDDIEGTTSKYVKELLKPAKQIMNVDDIRGAQSRRSIRAINRPLGQPADYSDVVRGKRETYNDPQPHKIRARAS